MPIKFEPNYNITPKIMNCLMRIGAVKEKILHLPLTPTVLSSLKETARLYTTHYSTMIEGNRLNPNQIKEVLKHEGHFPGRKRDECEVKGYYSAIIRLEQEVAAGGSVTEKMIQILHALVMADGKTKVDFLHNPTSADNCGVAPVLESSRTKRTLRFCAPWAPSTCLTEAGYVRSLVKPTEYRDGQNAIYDGITRNIVYMPPEAKDVKDLMAGMVTWINKNTDLPCPIVAGIAHYQFATIHPYYDGNGRTARLLTTFILHLGEYDLKGLYSLEEYYARNLEAYYRAISIGKSHNYYMGRAEANITKWIEYFVDGMAVSFENVLKRMIEADNQGSVDQSAIIRKLDPRQRKVLELFQAFETITSHQIGELFSFKPRTSAALCAKWVQDNFLDIADPSNKGRKYKLSKQYQKLIKS